MKRSILEYLDYRCYLYDVCEVVKQHGNPLNKWAAGIGVSGNKLTDVIISSQHLTRGEMFAIRDVLNLNDVEKLYFEHLVLFGKSRGLKNCRLHYKMMMKLRNEIPESNMVSRCELLKRWYTGALYALICHGPISKESIFTEASEFRYPISRMELDRALQNLTEYGLIKDELGDLRLSPGLGTTLFNVSEIKVQFFSQTLREKLSRIQVLKKPILPTTNLTQTGTTPMMSFLNK